MNPRLYNIQNIESVLRFLSAKANTAFLWISRPLGTILILRHGFVFGWSAIFYYNLPILKSSDVQYAISLYLTLFLTLRLFDVEWKSTINITPILIILILWTCCVCGSDRLIFNFCNNLIFIYFTWQKCRLLWQFYARFFHMTNVSASIYDTWNILPESITKGI